MHQLERFLLGLLGGVAAVAVAWVAFQLQQDQIAPAVIFPAAVGAALGGLLLAMRRGIGPRLRRVAIAAAMFWGLVTVVSQDFFGYYYRAMMFDAQVAGGHPLAAAMANERDLRPTFAGHLAERVGGRPGWWAVDLVLTAAAAGGVVAWGTRSPAPAQPWSHQGGPFAPGETGTRAAD
jgi:hypothetical protein